MGQDIQAGHVYSDTEGGRTVTSDNLNEHVNGAVIKESFISGKPAKGVPQLTDVFLLSDGALRKTSLQAVLDLFQPAGFLAATADGRAKMADLFFSADETGRGKFAAAFINAALLGADAIHGKAGITSLADLDEIVVWDESTSDLRKITRADFSREIAPAGGILNSAYAEFGNYTSIGSPFIPFDNSIPQRTEGTQILSASITPKANTSKVLVTVTVHMVPGTTIPAVAAVFRNSENNAIAVANLAGPTNADGPQTVQFSYLDEPASASEQTYTVRAGSGSGTLYINGISSGQRYGGALKCTLLVQEIKA